FSRDRPPFGTVVEPPDDRFNRAPILLAGPRATNLHRHNRRFELRPLGIRQDLHRLATPMPNKISRPVTSASHQLRTDPSPCVASAFVGAGAAFGIGAFVSPQPSPHNTLNPNAQTSKTSTAPHAIRPPGPRKRIMQPAASRARAAGQAGAVARRALAPILRLGRQVRAELPSTLRTQLGRV